MTTPPPPLWPEEIYLYQIGDAVQGGPDGTANVPLKQLKTRTDLLRAGQELQADQIADITTNLTELTEQVAGSQAEVLAGVVRAQMSGAGVYSEQFAAGWTLIDLGAGTAPLPLTNAVVPVAGDDSLDVTSTAKLIVGETYVLFDDHGYRQEVTVSQILDTTRIRVTPALTGAVQFPAWISRTDWDVSTPRQATAPAGGLYRTRPLDLGAPGPQPKAIIIRHEGPGALDVEWQAQGSAEFIDAPWWRRRTVDGQTETQYLLPTSGPTRLRITAVGGAVTVHWIATQPTPAMAEGAYNPSPRPRLISPVQGDQALGPQPVLQIAAYTPPPGLTVAGVVYEVAKTSDNAVVHTSAPQAIGAAYTLPDAVVQQGTDYRLTARIKAASGALGDPSKPIAGRTIPDFRVILAPTILTPATNYSTVQTGTAVTLSPYQVLRGVEVQAGVQMQVRRVGTEWDAAWDSGTLPVDSALSLQAPAVSMGWAVEVRCRYIGTTLGAGAWSVPRLVTIDTEIWLTNPGTGTFEIPEAGNWLVIPVGGGASGGFGGGGSGSGGGSGYRPDPVPTRFYTQGQLVDYRVGLGGPPVLGSNLLNGALPFDFQMAGQDSYFGDVVGLGAFGVPFGTPPLAPSQNGGQYDRSGTGGIGSSYGGPAPGNGNFGLGSSNGLPNGEDPNYWSSLDLKPGAPGHGAGGLEPQDGSIDLAGDGYWLNPATGTVTGGSGGRGYSAGGGGAPYIVNLATIADAASARSGAGAPGVIILRKVS